MLITKGSRSVSHSVCLTEIAQKSVATPDENIVWGDGAVSDTLAVEVIQRVCHVVSVL